MIEISPDRFNGVGVVLVQALGASRGCAKRIEERHLDQIVAIVGALDEAPGLSDMEPDLGTTVDAAGKVGVLVKDEVEDLRIELHGVDLPGTVIERQEHLLA